MSTLTIIIVSVFILGYLCIALESVLKINKAAIALFRFVATTRTKCGGLPDC